MLLAEINRNHRGNYDFFYLPIDFKNKCNMGYAFINFIEAAHIEAFHKEFDGQKWTNFNSEKVCAISSSNVFAATIPAATAARPAAAFACRLSSAATRDGSARNASCADSQWAPLRRADTAAAVHPFVPAERPPTGVAVFVWGGRDAVEYAGLHALRGIRDAR
ncbi:hypothetical protein ON010_g13809 [Phytophthora cinnamomi]|nr:hypothetical protein ON010_g13809 [Phytophthora cinnamomi]